MDSLNYMSLWVTKLQQNPEDGTGLFKQMLSLRSLLPHLPSALQPLSQVVCHSEDATKSPLHLGPLQQRRMDLSLWGRGGVLFHGWGGHHLGSQLDPKWAEERNGVSIGSMVETRYSSLPD